MRIRCHKTPAHTLAPFSFLLVRIAPCCSRYNNYDRNHSRFPNTPLKTLPRCKLQPPHWTTFRDSLRKDQGLKVFSFSGSHVVNRVNRVSVTFPHFTFLFWPGSNLNALPRSTVDRASYSISLAHFPQNPTRIKLLTRRHSKVNSFSHPSGNPLYPARADLLSTCGLPVKLVDMVWFHRPSGFLPAQYQR